MKHLSLTCISILPALAVTASASAQFSVQHLGTFGPAVTFEMNDSGQICGDYQFMALTTPMRYTPGVGIQARSTPAGSGLGYALGINNAGACIGMLDMPGAAPSAAVIWDANNVMTELPLPAGWTYNTGTAINDSNVACGYLTLAIVGDDPVSAWRWDAVNGYTVLPHLAGNYAYSGANDMNASGVICGISKPSESAASHAVIWDASNQVTEIPLVPGATSNTAWAINDAGVVVGDSNGNNAPWRYTPGVGVVPLAKFGTQPAYARGINNAGWVVGYAWQSGEPQTVVWDPNGVIYKIKDYVSATGYYFPSDQSIPIAISNNNDLVVRAMDFAVSGDPRAVRFHFGFPTPCPADIDGNHSVDVNDLLSVISTWGACANPNNCPADIAPAGGDDVVDVNDLLAVITTWGACP